jgi:hypothetical protein
MQSPFKILRQYQKVLLATMAVVAMISFGVGGIITRMTGSRGSAQADVVVETNVDNLTQDGLRKLMHRRYLANAFMYKALLASNPEYEKIAQFMPSLAQQFGSQSPQEVEFAWLMLHEARRLGVVVDNAQIADFIRQATNRKLSEAQFSRVLESMQIKAPELYDILRDELQWQTAYRLMSPVAAQSPEQFWKYYRQLHTRQKIEVAPVPIKDFASGIEPPPAASLEKFFSSHKTQFETSANGEYRPGFRQPPKVKLHYLQFTYLGVEEQILKNSPVTDKEIEEYYEAKKTIDRRFQDVDSAPPVDNESLPIDAEVAPEGDKRPEPPATPTDESPENSEPESPCGAPEDKPADDKPADDQAADKPDADGPAKAEAKSNESPPPAEEESDEQPATEDKTPPFGAGKPPRKPAVRPLKFKPLNDELRDLIRESIVHERTLARMKEVASKAADALRDVGLELAQQKEFDISRGKPEDLARLADRSREKLQEIAEKFAAKFGETGLVSARELTELPGIGKAQEPDANEFVPGGVRTIVDLAFDSDALCRVVEAEAGASSASRDMYVFWKVQHVPAHVPTFDEPGVKEQALEAWKLQQALPEAKKRAEQLAELVRNSKESMSAVLAGQTVTGSAKALALTVQESPEFSWWRESSAPDTSMRQPPLQLSKPVVVTGAGMKFMEFVFDELDEGDVGVVLNEDASVCYVVKVISRRPADREAFKSAPLFSTTSPYGRLAQFGQQVANREFIQQLEKAYAVKRHFDSAAMPAADGDE